MNTCLKCGKNIPEYFYLKNIKKKRKFCCPQHGSQYSKNEYYKRNPGKRKETDRAYREKNREKFREWNRKYYARHKDEIAKAKKGLSSRYPSSNPERRKSYNCKYRILHHEKVLSLKKEWRKRRTEKKRMLKRDVKKKCESCGAEMYAYRLTGSGIYTKLRPVKYCQECVIRSPLRGKHLSEKLKELIRNKMTKCKKCGKDIHEYVFKNVRFVKKSFCNSCYKPHFNRKPERIGSYTINEFELPDIKTTCINCGKDIPAFYKDAKGIVRERIYCNEKCSKRFRQRKNYYGFSKEKKERIKLLRIKRNPGMANYEQRKNALIKCKYCGKETNQYYSGRNGELHKKKGGCCNLGCYKKLPEVLEKEYLRCLYGSSRLVSKELKKSSALIYLTRKSLGLNSRLARIPKEKLKPLIEKIIKGETHEAYRRDL